MDELITQGQWWWLLPVPVLTFVFAVAGSWWGSRLGRTTEHWQWLRNEKQKIYITVLDEIEDTLEHISAIIDQKPLETDIRKFEAYLTPLKILGPEGLTDCYVSTLKKIGLCLQILEEGASEEVRDRARQSFMAARDEKNALLSLIRADLKVRS